MNQMTNTTLPITERANSKSLNIDLQSALDICKTLSSCESEIFGGYEDSQGVFDNYFVEKSVNYIRQMSMQIRSTQKIDVILIGAGTSGRLCRLMAKVLQPVVSENINLIPIIAGGIKALVRAEPNTEDMFQVGVDDYLAYTKDINRENCYVIGVTCGLSANYVMGALSEANRYSYGKTAIIGFNLVEQATINIDNDIVVLNPIIGPEPIVGSVRMKGGTTTMIMIYALLTAAINTDRQIYMNFINVLQDSRRVLSMMDHYHDKISQLITLGHNILSNGGSINLLGGSLFGTLCIYDAAECPPTFGATLFQVNGYTENGVDDLVYYDYEHGSKMAKDINATHFGEATELDNNSLKLSIRIGDSNFDNNPQMSSIIIETISSPITHAIIIDINEEWKGEFFKLLFVRSLLGQLSTGSFTLSGKIYQNKMIDLRITNKKLFNRATRIIQDITNRSFDEIQCQLIQNIYEGESPMKGSLEDHITLSATRKNIVPITILSLLYPKKNINEIRLMLNNEPVIRRLIKEQLEIMEIGNHEQN